MLFHGHASVELTSLHGEALTNLCSVQEVYDGYIFISSQVNRFNGSVCYVSIKEQYQQTN